jgi:hypothetical protein
MGGWFIATTHALLRLAYNNARNADFRSGVAHGVTFWQEEPKNFPISNGQVEIYAAIRESINKHDPTMLTGYLRNKPMNWRNVRSVNTLLSMYNIEP